ncbi:PP2C family protein-serine/threonine phosphatase [Yinghuangia aomiensis]
MDQVYRTGRGRTVRARRVDHHGTAYPGMPESERQHGYFTFVCTPVCADGTPGDAAVRGRAGVRACWCSPSTSPTRCRPPTGCGRANAGTGRPPSPCSAAALPQQLEHPDDLRVSARYLPGGADAAVGGDWYDVITLGAGRTALVIGDVMGRGVRAAAVMGQLRTAVRAYARLDLPPHEVLQAPGRLGDGDRRHADRHLCVRVHDPSEGVPTYSTAGHLPPLVRDLAGDVHRLDEALGPPLGTGGSWPHTSGSVPLGLVSTVVLYTDGLVERRGEDIDRGIDDLGRRPRRRGRAGPTRPRDRLIEHMRHPPVEHGLSTWPCWCRTCRGATKAAPPRRSAPRRSTRSSGNEVAARARAVTLDRRAGELRGRSARNCAGTWGAARSARSSSRTRSPTAPHRCGCWPAAHRPARRLIVEVSDADDHAPRHRRASADDENGRGVARSRPSIAQTRWGLPADRDRQDRCGANSCCERAGTAERPVPGPSAREPGTGTGHAASAAVFASSDRPAPPGLFGPLRGALRARRRDDEPALHRAGGPGRAGRLRHRDQHRAGHQHHQVGAV